jgi:hypothetical protein
MDTNFTAAQERDELVALFARGEQALAAALEGVTEAEAEARLDTASWSILQVAEHVALAEAGMGWLLASLEERPTPPNRAFDTKIRAVMPDRTRKAMAPETTLPAGRWKSVPEALAAFRAHRAHTLEMMRAGGVLRQRRGRHPRLGEVDGVQLCMIMALHVERHALQITEIRQRRAAKTI